MKTFIEVVKQIASRLKYGISFWKKIISALCIHQFVKCGHVKVNL